MACNLALRISPEMLTPAFDLNEHSFFATQLDVVATFGNDDSGFAPARPYLNCQPSGYGVLITKAPARI